LFRTPGPCQRRIVLVDGPMQAICLAALKPHAHGTTTFAAPGGGRGRGLQTRRPPPLSPLIPRGR
jgi:hypothetical protein